jgi:hypothetical protein
MFMNVHCQTAPPAVQRRVQSEMVVIQVQKKFTTGPVPGDLYKKLAALSGAGAFSVPRSGQLSDGRVTKGHQFLCHAITVSVTEKGSLPEIRINHVQMAVYVVEREVWDSGLFGRASCG